MEKPRLLLIHGSATDRTTWSIQLHSPLRETFALIAYTRRSDAPSVEAHADDAIAQLGEDRRPALVCGSSFGAVVALDAIRRHPARFTGAVLIEPPLAPADDASPAPAAFLAEYDRIAAAQGGPAAAERFLRMVLGDAMVDRMPRAFLHSSTSKWQEIRADSAALIAYQPRYADLAAVTTPVLLLGGERSPPYFRVTLEALGRALPHARLEVLAAGHMLHAEAHRRFTEVVTSFAAAISS